MVRWLFLTLFLLTSAPAAQAQLCSQGVKIADSCFVNPTAGCCFATNKHRYCENGVTCEVDCTVGFSPKTCGWRATEGRYTCGISNAREPSCTHPYSCHGHGCLATTNFGCCGCTGEAMACWMYEECCDYSYYTWSSNCAYYNGLYGGCGNRDACTPSPLPGCFGCACETCVCAKDPTCCTGMWAEHCVTHCIHCGTNCPTCYPLCEGKECGDNGCDDVCGICVGDTVCMDHKCVCAPNCVNKQCGNDGCGGTCGTCPPGWYCVNNNCTTSCLPSCDNKQCGDDGCGGICGTCEPGFHCSPTGQCSECMADCNGKICGDDGCGGVCGWCPGAWSCIDGQCVNNCVPICAGKQCGDDGCGGSCGVCGPSENCIHHQCAVPCVPICAGKECGADGCGGQCGNCPVDYFCEANQCVILYPDDVVIEEVVEPHDLLDDRDVPDILYPDAESPDSRAILPDAAGPSDGSGGFEVRSDVKQPLNCGPGMKNQLGQCVPDDPEEPQPEPAASSGCHSSHQTSPGALLLLVLLVLSTLVMRLRPWRIPS